MSCCGAQAQFACQTRFRPPSPAGFFSLREKDWGVAPNPNKTFDNRKTAGLSAKPAKEQVPNALDNQHLAQGGYQRGCPPLMAFGFFSP